MNFSNDLSAKAAGHQNSTQSHTVKMQPVNGASSALAAVKSK